MVLREILGICGSDGHSQCWECCFRTNSLLPTLIQVPMGTPDGVMPESHIILLPTFMGYLSLGCGFPLFRGWILPHPEGDPASPHLPQAPVIYSLREMILGNLPFILDNEPGISGAGRTALLWKHQGNIRKSPIPKEHPNCPCS